VTVEAKSPRQRHRTAAGYFPMRNSCATMPRQHRPDTSKAAASASRAKRRRIVGGLATVGSVTPSGRT